MGGRRTRKAALPAAGYTRPASLDDSGLKVTIYEEDGTVAGVCDFTRLPGSTELRRAFAIAIDRKSGPGGTWRSYATCRHGLQVVRVFLAYLAGRENPPRLRRRSPRRRGPRGGSHCPPAARATASCRSCSRTACTSTGLRVMCPFLSRPLI